jgi:PST family polysaccharide transporter
MLLLRRRNKASDGDDTRGDEPRELSADVRRGALWNIGSTILLRLASIFTTAIIARILNPRDFGVFAVALTAYGIVSAVGELGVAACLVRADLDLDSLAPTMATVSLTTSAVLAFAMAAFARPIAAALGSAAAAGPVRVMSLAVLLVGVFAVPGAQLVRDFKQDKLFIANVVGFVPSTVLVLLLAKSGQGAMAFAWSRVVGQAFTGLVFILSVPKIYRPGFTRGALSFLVKFGLPLAGANFVNYILLNVDYALVGHLMGAVALGIYVLAFNVASWPSTLLSSMINNVSMPAFSRVQHDADLLRNTIASALRSLSLVVMPMCALIMALAAPLVLTLYGVKWAASAEVLSVLALYSAVSVICLLFANILAGLGRTTFLLVVQLVWLGALVPAMVLGVHQDGIVGAAYAHIAVIGPVVLPSYLLVLRRVTGVRFSALVKAVLPAFLAASGAALAARACASLLSLPLAQLVAGLAVGGLVYLIATAPLLIALLIPGQTTNPYVQRVLGVYAAAARLAGLSGAARPKHSAGRGRWREAQAAGAVSEAPALGYQLFTPAGRPVSDKSVQSTAAALAMLISLARPEPPAAPLARPEPHTVPTPRQRPTALAVPYERRNSQL